MYFFSRLLPASVTFLPYFEQIKSQLSVITAATVKFMGGSLRYYSLITIIADTIDFLKFHTSHRETAVLTDPESCSYIHCGQVALSSNNTIFPLMLL